MAVGAAIGLIFPPSVLVSGLVGAGAGALCVMVIYGLAKDSEYSESA